MSIAVYNGEYESDVGQTSQKDVQIDGHRQSKTKTKTKTIKGV